MLGALFYALHDRHRQQLLSCNGTSKTNAYTLLDHWREQTNYRQLRKPPHYLWCKTTETTCSSVQLIRLQFQLFDFDLYKHILVVFILF